MISCCSKEDTNRQWTGPSGFTSDRAGGIEIDSTTLYSIHPIPPVFTHHAARAVYDDELDDTSAAATAWPPYPMHAMPLPQAPFSHQPHNSCLSISFVFTNQQTTLPGVIPTSVTPTDAPASTSCLRTNRCFDKTRTISHIKYIRCTPTCISIRNESQRSSPGLGVIKFLKQVPHPQDQIKSIDSQTT